MSTIWFDVIYGCHERHKFDVKKLILGIKVFCLTTSILIFQVLLL